MLINNTAINHADRVLATVGSGQSAATSSIAASWCRSALHHGLDPGTQRRRERLDSNDLGHLLERNGELLAAAEPVLAALFGNVRSAGCCVILADIDGIVLDMRSAAGDQKVFESIGLQGGVSWSEASEGTNGIGTCLVEGRSLSVDQSEHFSSRNTGVSCIDAPVFGPNGELIGALDISSCRTNSRDSFIPLVTSLVQEAARQIERNFFCQSYADARILYAPDPLGRGSALLAVDKDDLLIGATRSARRKYKISQAQINSPSPVVDILGVDRPTRFDDSERMVLRQALSRSRGNVSIAARALGIGRATFYRRMERVGLTPVNRGTAAKPN
ncbi:GAF domain-containing protein [Novosphingobium sp. M1R2S20]|uniref:GAF domain-containing protein n=1 Tax=Novosphingobium rhizovicinum TaxID=3228928 RepID=A0ABV3RBE9_9SPHN